MKVLRPTGVPTAFGYAGTFDHGLYAFERGVSTGVENPPMVPARMELEQNYPNPFNPSTTIGFEVPLAREPSGVPGHAMKASPVSVNGVEIYPAGTIVGKALEPFTGGQGVIKVLVTLK